MEVLRQDVEEIEKEMEAYLAKTDEKREEAETLLKLTWITKTRVSIQFS